MTKDNFNPAPDSSAQEELMIVQYWTEKNKISAERLEQQPGLRQQLQEKATAARLALITQNLFNEKDGEIWYSIDRHTFEQLKAG